MGQFDRPLNGGFLVSRGVSGQKRGLEAHVFDLSDADEVEPPGQIGRVEVRPVFGSGAGRIDACTVENPRDLVIQQATIAGLRVKSEQQTRLGDDVDILLELISCLLYTSDAADE